MELAALRNDMVAALRERRHVGEPVAAAMRAVPRHLFVPGVGPEAAYRGRPIVTKHDEHGTPISSSSQPAIMAAMLDQLGVRPGHRVLEIGAGAGYHAARARRRGRHRREAPHHPGAELRVGHPAFPSGLEGSCAALPEPRVPVPLPCCARRRRAFLRARVRSVRRRSRGCRGSQGQRWRVS
ncbi:hypothetical protein E1267_30370 [Nonomuraea longispora]|uniref:Protein-L-isoaspartate O-methyltransferase n=1 Tax=Nonomuraea longispora TaxID=1848320 RepID=A0A4R4N064_9ACTN|nr:hypothetical protein [Nonomuraea longispora]TDC01999.1 hypothetical protein E1267_30370 [Nonomuraea longispora]